MGCVYSSSPSEAVEDETPFTYEKGFRYLRRLGSGGFGVVNESQRISDEQIFAIKRAHLPDDLNRQEKVLREVLLCKKLEHPHIVKYYNHWTETSSVEEANRSDTWKTSDGEADLIEDSNDEDVSNDNSNHVVDVESSNIHDDTTRRAESIASNSNSKKNSAPKKKYKPERTYLFIQMELCSDVNLKDWLVQTERRPLSLIHKFLFQITSALKYIHERCLMHRDLKPGNIFFSEDDVLKVGDFGLVKQFTPPPASQIDGSQESNCDHSPGIGSPCYQSLEQMDRTGRYKNKVDIYALGVIWVELLYFFKTDSERRIVLAALRDRNFPENFATQYPQEHDILMEMLSPNPIQRPNAVDIMNRLLDMYPSLRADQSIQDLMVDED